MRSAVQQYGAHPKFTGNCAHKIINIKEIPWIYNQLLKMDKFANQKNRHISGCNLSIFLGNTLSIYLSIYLSVHLSIYLLLHSWTWIPGSLWRTEAGVSQLNLDSRVTVELRNLPTYLSIYLFIYLPTYLSIYLLLHSWTWIPGSLWRTEAGVSQLNRWTWIPGSLWSSAIYLPTYLSIYLPTYLSIYLSVHLSIYLLLHSWTWIPGSLWRTEAGVSQLNLDSRVTVELRNLPTYLSIYLSTYLPTYLSIYPSIYLSIYCFTVEPGFQGHCEGLRLGFHSWTWIPGSLWSSAMEPGIQGPFSWIRRALNKGHIILLKKESPEQGLVRALKKQ